jgi:ABC-type nitrate/sulfonate/bicarbonate transport system substrate-binding protein
MLSGKNRNRFCTAIFACLLVIASRGYLSAAETIVGYPGGSLLQGTLFVALEGGHFKNHGLDVVIVMLPGVQVIQALVAGSVKFTHGVSSRTVPSAAAAGSDVVLIASPINDLIFDMFSRPELRRPEDLKGKIVGVSAFGTSTDYAARQALLRHRLVPDKDVMIRGLGSVPAVLAALDSGQIAAGVISPPTSVRAEKLGFYKIIDIVSMKIPYASSGVGVRKATLANDKSTVLSFLKGLIEGIHRMKTDRRFALQALKKHTRMSDMELLEKSYDLVLPTISRVPYASLEAVQTSIDSLAETTPALKGRKAEEFVDNGFLREIEASGFVDKLWKK